MLHTVLYLTCNFCRLYIIPVKKKPGGLLDEPKEKRKLQDITYKYMTIKQISTRCPNPTKLFLQVPKLPVFLVILHLLDYPSYWQ